MRTLVRLLLFVSGVLMIAVATTPLLPAELLQNEMVKLLDLPSVWRTALFAMLAFSLSRTFYIGWIRAGRRVPESHLWAILFSFFSLVFSMAPDWNPLPSGTLTVFTALFMVYAGISLMWMTTYSGRVTEVVYGTRKRTRKGVSWTEEPSTASLGQETVRQRRTEPAPLPWTQPPKEDCPDSVVFDLNDPVVTPFNGRSRRNVR